MINSKIEHLRISIKSHGSHADANFDRVSRLFHRELKFLLSRVFDEVIPAGGSIRLESPLILKLGDIPGAFFERIFCQRLESALEQALRSLLVEQTDLWRRDSPAQCRALLRQALRSREESADSWLVRQLELGPDIWWPVLAEYALLPEGAELYHRLRQETVRDLCRQLAPDVLPQGDVTGDSLWLSALHYFQQHPMLPVPPASLTAVTGVSPELQGGASAAPAKRYDVRLIQALFEHPAPPSASLTFWLRAIWQNPAGVGNVRSVLSPVRIAQWHQHLISTSLKTQPSQESQLSQQSLSSPPSRASRSEDRKPALYSDAQWQPVSCAGMVLLWPMLPGLFRHLGLVQGKQFINMQAQHRAVGCLMWLALRQSEPPPEQAIGRLMCGLSAEGEITPEDMPDDITREQLRQWLVGLPASLPSTWKKLSAEDIRQWFLLRPGWVPQASGSALLHVQPEAFDILLNDWPWPVNLVPLPWLEQTLTVRWAEVT
jgi:hypothetical protein